jgi:hypothetical protein
MLIISILITIFHGYQTASSGSDFGFFNSYLFPTQFLQGSAVRGYCRTIYLKTLKIKIMKTLRIVMLLMALSMITYYTKAQDIYRNIPSPATNNFSTKYPGVTVKNWKKDAAGYEALFKMNKEKSTAYYDPSGNWVRTETNVPLSKLPVDIRYALRQSNFASYHIDDVRNIHTPITDMYRLEVDNNGGNPDSYTDLGSMDNRLLYFSPSGHLLKTKDNNK